MELKPLFKGIADAIREKDGTTDPIVASDFPERIASIPTGSPGVASTKDVNFYDYDGTLLYSYILAEAQALTALPEGPVHEGLIFQGWNWSLEKVKALTRAMNIGAIYITDDGKTRLKIHIWDTARSDAPLYIQQTVANGVTIDWGDGSPTETLDGTGKVNTTHKYSAVGDYTISLAVADGCELGLGHGSKSHCVLGSIDSSQPTYKNLLEEVYIGHGVSIIDAYAFCECDLLSSITIPNTVTSIKTSAFNGCAILSSITIPDGVTNIYTDTFRYCYGLSSITIPNSVTSIGSFVFYGCYTFSSITIPDGVTSIGEYAFSMNRALSSITIPDGVTTIRGHAFDGCLYLSSITIPNTVTSIETSAFAGCAILSSITIPNSVTSIGTYMLSGCINLSSITISNGIRNIANNMFSQCRSLSRITIPDGVTSIGEYAFSGGDALLSITIPDGVTSIGVSAFSFCYSLASIRIPDSVNRISRSAFNGCASMAEYHLKPTVPPTLDNVNAFNGIPSDCIIYVPKGSLEAYKTATNWSTYADHMQEE